MVFFSATRTPLKSARDLAGLALITLDLRINKRLNTIDTSSSNHPVVSRTPPPPPPLAKGRAPAHTLSHNARARKKNLKEGPVAWLTDHAAPAAAQQQCVTSQRAALVEAAGRRSQVALSVAAAWKLALHFGW